MANLQIKGIDDALYEEIKALASAENRSVSQQTIYLLRTWLSQKKPAQTVNTSAEVLLGLSGAWQDDKSAEDIVAELKSARHNSDKFREGF